MSRPHVGIKNGASVKSAQRTGEIRALIVIGSDSRQAFPRLPLNGCLVKVLTVPLENRNFARVTAVQGYMDLGMPLEANAELEEINSCRGFNVLISGTLLLPSKKAMNP